SSDFSSAANDLDIRDTIDVTRLPFSPSDWKYLELVIDGSRESFGLCSPQSPPRLPPTKVGQAAVKAWFVNSDVLDDAAIRQGVLVSALAASGKHKDFARDLIQAWANISPVLERSNVPPSWLTNSQMVIGGNSRILKSESPNSKYESLFLEAITESKPK